MFKVQHRETKQIFTVYAVNSERTDIMFLLDDGDRKFDCWHWDNAEYYYPYEEEK
jgi:hypothetical protein